MSAVEDVVTEAPAVEAVPKRAMTLGYGTSLAMLALLLIVPLFVKNFIIFQMTMLLIYGLAVLALNILTGGCGPVLARPERVLRGRRLHVGDPDGTRQHELRADAADRGHHLLCVRLPVRPAGAAPLRRLPGAGDLSH